MEHTARQIIVIPQAGSTNKEAFRILETDFLEHGTVIITPNQTAGRGQGMSIWESEPGSNLTFSLILRPDFLEVSRQFMLTKVISLSIKKIIQSLVVQHPVFIKWPNDIYIDKGKVAGILIENRIMGSQFQVCVAGIGINVNQKSFQSAAPNPVSICQVTKGQHNTEEILHLVCDEIDFRYKQLQDGNYSLLDNDYLQSLLGINTTRNFKRKGNIFSANIVGVSEYGQLILKEDSGITREYDLKEVEFLFK